jgi:hypothetical protein
LLIHWIFSCVRGAQKRGEEEKISRRRRIERSSLSRDYFSTISSCGNKNSAVGGQIEVDTEESIMLSSISRVARSPVLVSVVWYHVPSAAEVLFFFPLVGTE